jgi:hypothetical protein
MKSDSPFTAIQAFKSDKFSHLQLANKLALFKRSQLHNDANAAMYAFFRSHRNFKLHVCTDIRMGQRKMLSLKTDTVINHNDQTRYQVTSKFDTCNGFVGNVQHTLFIVLVHRKCQATF